MLFLFTHRSADETPTAAFERARSTHDSAGIRSAAQKFLNAYRGDGKFREALDERDRRKPRGGGL